MSSPLPHYNLNTPNLTLHLLYCICPSAHPSLKFKILTGKLAAGIRVHTRCNAFLAYTSVARWWLNMWHVCVCLWHNCMYFLFVPDEQTAPADDHRRHTPSDTRCMTLGRGQLCLPFVRHHPLAQRAKIKSQKNVFGPWKHGDTWKRTAATITIIRDSQLVASFCNSDTSK